MQPKNVDYRYFQLQIQKNKLTESEKKALLSLCDKDSKLKDIMLKEYGTNNTTLLYHCIKFRSLYIFLCIIRQIVTRTSLDHTELNKGCRRLATKFTKNLEVTLLCKILMSLRKKPFVETHKKMYHEMIYLLLLCDVDIDKKSLVEAEENKAKQYRISSALELAYTLYIPDLFVALTLNKKQNNFKEKKEMEFEIIQDIIVKLWQGSALGCIECDDHVISILSTALHYYHLIRNTKFFKCIEKTSSCIGAGDSMAKYYKFINYTNKFAKKWNGKSFLLDRFWPKPHINKLKLIDLHLKYKAGKKTKGFSQFVSYLPEFYNLCSLCLVTTTFNVLDQHHCCQLFESLNILCRRNYALKNIKFEGFSISKKSSKLLARWLENWNYGLNGVHIVKTLSLVNVRYNNKAIQLLCNAIICNDRLVFRNLILDRNVFDISGMHFISLMLQNQRICKQLQLLQMQHLQYIHFDHGDSLLKVYLIKCATKHNFQLVLETVVKDDDIPTNNDTGINQCLNYVKSCNELFEIRSNYFQNQIYKYHNKTTQEKQFLKHTESKYKTTYQNVKYNCHSTKEKIQYLRGILYAKVQEYASQKYLADIIIDILLQLNISEILELLNEQNLKKCVNQILSNLSVTTEADYVKTESSLRCLTPNEIMWKYQMTKIEDVCKATTCPRKMQSNPHFQPDKYDSSYWRVPKPNFSQTAQKSRRICLFKPYELNLNKHQNEQLTHKRVHSHEQRNLFTETDDCVIYNAKFKYLFIQLKTVKDVTVEIDLSMFDALNVKFCYIKLCNAECSLTLSNSCESKIYFRNMICIQGAKHLCLASKCNIKTAQLWLLEIDTVTFDEECKISTISSWFCRCKNIINNGILSHITMCWINRGDIGQEIESKQSEDTFLNNGSIFSDCYLYIEIDSILNKNLIECEIFYHASCCKYEDTSNSNTIIWDHIYFDIKEICIINGNLFANNSMILNCANKLTLSSKSITMNNFCYIRAKQLNMTNMQMLIRTNTISAITSNKNNEPNISDKKNNPMNISYIYGSCDESVLFYQSYIKKAMLYVQSSSIDIIDSQIIDQTSDGVIIFNRIDQQMKVTELRLSSRHKLYLLNSNVIHIKESFLKCNYIEIANSKNIQFTSTKKNSKSIITSSLFVKDCNTIQFLNNINITCEHTLNIENSNINKSGVVIVEGIVMAKNVIISTNKCQVSGIIRTHSDQKKLKLIEDAKQNLNQDHKVTVTDELDCIAYECSMKVTNSVKITGCIDAVNLFITSNKCTINGQVKCDIFYIKIGNNINFGTNELLIKSSNLLYIIMMETSFLADGAFVIKANNNAAKVLLNSESITVNHCAITSSKICKVQNTANLKIISSTLNTNKLYFHHISQLITNQIHVQSSNIIQAFNVNTIGMFCSTIQSGTVLIDNSNIIKIKENTCFECKDQFRIKNTVTFGMDKGCNIVIAQGQQIDEHQTMYAKYELFDCIVNVYKLLTVDGAVKANNIYFNAKTLNVSGSIESYLGPDSYIINSEISTNNIESVSYECVLDIKEKIQMSGNIKVRNSFISANECHISGSVESNILHLKMEEIISLVSNKLFITNYQLMCLTMKCIVFQSQNQITIQSNNISAEDEAKMLILPNSINITHCKIQSEKICKLSNIDEVTIKSSKFVTSSLEMSHCDTVKYMPNTTIYCTDRFNVTNVNNLEMSIDAELYTAKHASLMLLSQDSEHNYVSNNQQSIMSKPSYSIEILKNEDIASSYIQIQSITRKAGNIHNTYDDESIEINVTFNELPFEETVYIYECNKKKQYELAKIKLREDVMCYTAVVDLIDFMDEGNNFENINTMHSFAVFTNKNNPTIYSNSIKCILPSIHEYASETEIVPNTISMHTVKAFSIENIVNVYWDYPSTLTTMANMAYMHCDIKYRVTYLNSDGSRKEDIVNSLPLTMLTAKLPVSFQVTTLMITNTSSMQYESEPSKIITIDFPATSKQQNNVTDEFKKEKEMFQIDERTNQQVNKHDYNQIKKHENDLDSFECTMEIKQCLKMFGIVKANNTKLSANECNIAGFMESNILSISVAKYIDFGSNNLFIKTENQLNIMIMQNYVFSSAKKTLIEPIDHGDHESPMISINASQMIVQTCKIGSFGNVVIKNIPKFCCIKSSQINLNQAIFDQITCMKIDDNAEIHCSGAMDVRNVDTFMLNASKLSVTNGSCIIKLKLLFSMDDTSNIDCSYEHVQIICDKDIKLNGKIHTGECCTFKLFANQIICNTNFQIQSKSAFNTEDQRELQIVVQEYLTNRLEARNISDSNYYIHFYGRLKIDFNGKVFGNKSLCVMDSDEMVQISDNVVFELCDLYVHSGKQINFHSKYDYPNGQCYLCSDKLLNMNKNSLIQSNKVLFFGRESITINGEVDGIDINIESQNECNIECNRMNASKLIIKSMNLNCSKQIFHSNVIEIECKQRCKVVNSSNISCTKRLYIDGSTLQISNSTISGLIDSEMIWNVSTEINVSNNAIIESKILNMLNANSLVVKSSKMTVNQLRFKHIKSLQCFAGTEILYLNTFHAENIQQFQMNQNVMISINYESECFDSNAQNELSINCFNLSMNNGAKMYFSSQKAEIKCNNNLNLNGIIRMVKCNSVKGEKTKALTWQNIQINDLTQHVNTSLVRQHYIQLYSQNALNISGELIAPNSLSLIDCMKQINILKNAKMNTGMLYIRSLNDINFNGMIYNENGECFIGANNKLHLDRDGDICLLFLKHWSRNTKIDCTITADNLTVEQLEKRLNMLNDKINNFGSIKENDSELKELRRKMEVADRKYKRSIREISDTVDKTGLNEQNIRLFLQQLNQIRDCVIQQPESLAKMNQKLSTFITLMRREFNTELSIESYFDFQNLKKYANALKTEGYTKLKELECVNKNDPEYQTILSICQKIKGFNARVERELQHICLKSDSWKMYQNEKINVVTKQMAETAPLLKDCFGAIDNAMRQIQIATKNALDSQKTKNPINAVNKIAEESLKTIGKFKRDKCKEYKGDKMIKLKALTVATGISDCSSEIIKSQQAVAGSILLTKSILKLKPNELNKTEEHQSLEMRVKTRVYNATKQAWAPYIEQINKLKSLKHGRKKKTKQIKLHKEESTQNLIQVIDNLVFPLCFIQVVSVHQKITKTFQTTDDEEIQICIDIHKSPSKKVTYYLFECESGKNECLATIQVRQNISRYHALIDLIEFEPDSENEMDENHTINRNCKHLIALYKDKKKRKIISNCIEIILPEYDEYVSQEIPTIVPIATVKACQINDKNIGIFWQCPPKINVFGEISVEYEVICTDKNYNKTQKRIDRLPLVICTKNIPLSMQIVTIISTTTQTIESMPIEFVISNSSSIYMKETLKTFKTNNIPPQLTAVSTSSVINNNQSINPKPDICACHNSFKYRPSNNSGIYGSYQAQSHMQLKQVLTYKPSFSSGIYGAYFYQEEKKYTQIQRKENECLQLMYGYLSETDNTNIDHERQLQAWITKNKFNLDNICHDIGNPKTSKIKSFNCEIFKKLVTVTKSKTWKMKHKQFVLMNSAKLWNIVDDGVINIWSSNLVIIEIAMKYFNFFGKFRQSFDKLVKLNPQQTVVQAAKNKAKSFLKNMGWVSNRITISNEDEKIDVNRNNQIVQQLECIANDIEEFELIQQIFHNTINQLEEFALKCIKECIKEAPNSNRFENAQKEREKYRTEFERLQKLYDEKERQMNDKYDKWIALKLKLQARKIAAEHEQTQKKNQK